jgi:hypothetical protein
LQAARFLGNGRHPYFWGLMWCLRWYCVFISLLGELR